MNSKLLFLIFSTICVNSFAITGQEIIDLVKNQNQGYASEINEMKLTIMENSKVTAERKLKGKIIEISKGGTTNKSMIEFTHPTDVKGTKLLTWLMENEDKSQWIYLPSLNKSKRILASNSSSSFMGSEFTYSDIGGEPAGKFNYKLLAEKKDGNDIIWTVEQRAKDKSDNEYKIATIRKSTLNAEKTEFYNAKNEKFKEATISDFKKYTVGRKAIYKPMKISMKNHLNKNESVIEWESREFGAKLSEKDFSAQALERKR